MELREKCKRRKSALQTPKWEQKEGQDSPAACDAEHGEAGCPPAFHGDSQWNRDQPTAHGGPHAVAAGCPNEGVSPWEAHAAAPGRTCRPVEREAHTGAGFGGRTCDLMKNPWWNSSRRTSALRTVSHVGGGATCGGRRGRVELLWTDHSPHFTFPCSAGQGGHRKVRDEGLRWAWEEERGGKRVSSVFVFHPAILFLIRN